MRKSIIAGAILLLLALLLAAPAHTQGTPLSDYKICLDPGHLDSAICQYRACKAELARREDRAPSEQTRMLYQRLLENH